jgi:epoxide hydrolase-like predicted phosphatase
VTPSGLIVDYGGVLTTSVLDSFKEFCIASGVDPDALKTAILTEMEAQGTRAPAVHLVETGKIAIEAFNAHLASALSQGLPEPLEAEGLDERLFGTVRPEIDMIDAVQRIRSAGVGTALLSNSWGRAAYPREILDGMFDSLVISGEVGVRKPDPEAYLLAAEKIGRAPEECVFVDDFEENVRGAEAIGMVGIHHREPQETVARLEALFGL